MVRAGTTFNPRCSGRRTGVISGGRIRYRGISKFSGAPLGVAIDFEYPLAQLGLARALAAQDDIANTCTAFQDFRFMEER